jgi:hypothetical protein
MSRIVRMGSTSSTRRVPTGSIAHNLGRRAVSALAPRPLRRRR